LVGVREDSFLMSNVSILKFSISCMLLDKKTNLSWRLVIVYGSPYDEGKPEFIDELYLVLSKWQGPTIVGGDFNLYRFALDKSNGRINQKMADHFNDFINKWDLVEVSPSNRKFTWSINQKNLISAKIDRVLVTTDWEALFPFVKISRLSKGISDHIPLLLESGDNCFFGRKKFRFKKWWLQREDFEKVVKKAWSIELPRLCPMDRWQAKVRNLCRLVRGWAANVIAELNKHKQAVAAEYNALDLESESRPLNAQEQNIVKELARDLDRLWALEEIKAKQRSRDRDILEGDRNTSYFMTIANHRARTKDLTVS
jgi:hypothetical protein